MSNTLTTRVWIELCLLALIWGGSFLAIRTALDEVGFLSSVTHRVLWAALVLWGIVLVRRLPLPTSPALWGAFLVMGLLNNVLPFSLMAWGQLHIETGLTAILNAATAIWGVLVAALVFTDERLTARRLIGVSVGFAGVATAVGWANIASLDLRSWAQLAIIAGTVSYAFAGSWARAYLKDVSPLVSAAGMLTGATVIMLPLSYMIEGPLPLDLELRTWGAIGYYALAATAFAYL
ncbi:MAG: DMT family transporter, partial [Pseudomonadota bacterium]